MSDSDMAYIYSALILRSVDKEIDEANLRAVLEAGGMLVNENQIKVLLETLKEVSIEDIMARPTILPAVEAPVVETRKEKKKEPEQPAVDPAKGLDFLFQ